MGVMGLSVILPASDEADYIGACLGAMLASDPVAGGVEIIVVANGCRDATAEVARGFFGAARARGWRLTVMERAEGGKIGALNAGDAMASAAIRVYVDADVLVSPALFEELRAVLDRPEPLYASGTMEIAPARSWVSRAYGRVWRRVPFMADCVPGCGVFAVNAAGRARWKVFPPVISDDTFARLVFAPRERVGVPARYQWPIVEGFSRLVKVRRRQDAGVREIEARFPDLLANDDKPAFGLGRKLALALRDPVGFAVYCAVALAVKLTPGQAAGWSRGR